MSLSLSGVKRVNAEAEWAMTDLGVVCALAYSTVEGPDSRNGVKNRKSSLSVSLMMASEVLLK
jgi:hypothetical protein